MKRTTYTLSFFFVYIIILFSACQPEQSIKKNSFKLSLAQWSLHKTFFEGKENPFHFARIAKERYNIHAVEYVNQFYKEQKNDDGYWSTLRSFTDSIRVDNLLIMVDEEGELSSNDIAERINAVENHKRWIDIAHTLDCHSIRVNLHGHNVSEEEWIQNSIHSLSLLSTYAATLNISVLVENHGQWSSKSNSLVTIIKTVNMDNCGTLPDFGNFCVKRKDGDLWSSPCIETYDAYQGVAEMLPFAQGVSAKTIRFDEAGNETTFDFNRMMNIVKDSDYKGYIGVEFEGNEQQTEDEGIKMSIQLLEKYRN